MIALTEAFASIPNANAFRDSRAMIAPHRCPVQTIALATASASGQENAIVFLVSQAKIATALFCAL